jgi:hypothetical protein
MSDRVRANQLPLKRPLKDAANLSQIAAVLMTAASLAGLAFPAALYSTAELQQSYLTNDVVNLMIGLPVLIGSIWFTRRGSLLGLLLWPGALLYVVYNYLVYAFGNPLGWLTFISLALVAISTLAIINLFGSIKAETVKQQIADKTPRRFAGVVMIIFGLFFIVRVIGIVFGAVSGGTSLPLSEIGLAVADGTLSVLWVMGGVLLLRRQPLGYLSGLGLLFAASTLFIGLLIYFILEPFLLDVFFAWVDFLVVLLMSLVCFVPFGLYARAIRKSISNEVKGSQ